jgi:hypothetical protein
MEDAEERGGELDAVAEAHRYAVAPAHAPRPKRSSHAGRALGELRISETRLTADERFRCRPHPAGALESFVHGRWTRHEAAHPAIAEVAFLAGHN